jgi:hypothetical protein
MRTTLLVLSMGVTSAWLMFGCGVKNAIDCHGICARYQSCYDSSYDTGACEDRCRDNADHDSNYADEVDQCHSCMDDKSCASATFNCASPCANIVP